ncbi:phosphatase PAP2-related protein [Pedobacter duraquae]|uniref:PAP2 superfamily protein n=1 Tax=Pedobacter duraquae TaxID=425511 RepID=A0A4R6IP60_9SPHI|nr:phosphatase PAP2-related protein [Pedobacter duraquae]TDO23977.1 PAP2 superfamily protein [Pedobacter duraquae]
MQSKILSWQIAWDVPAFRVKLLLGLFFMGLILFLLPDFFLYIQGRDGFVVNDYVLRSIPTEDVSNWIFLVLYPAIGFFIWQLIGHTEMCVTALWGYIFMCLARMITISLIPLSEPVGLMHMSDPFSILFYGSSVITKDLFFSGHTATLCLIGLCLENKVQKRIVFVGTAVLGVLLLIQHIHYTMDVFAAPVFSYLFWYLGKTIAKI